MDTKSLAKSKRAHSQQHSRSRRQPHQHHAPNVHNPKPPSATPLQSNWDRYAEEEEDDSASGPLSHSGSNADIVFPKSKGADYRHLVAEARHSQSSNPFPSLDDVLAGEFSQAVGSMLSVKGEGILAWSGDDNFIVEDKTTSQPEASFLCLNLHTLAEQLEKIDLAQRLFIEADLLPPELRTEVSEASRSQECDQMPATNASVAVTQLSEDLNFLNSSVKLEHVDQASGVKSSVNIAGGGHPDPLPTLRGFGSVPGSAVESSMNSAAGTKENPPKFEAAAAEAELDMLLDSFNEIQILSTPGLSSTGTLSVQNEASVVTFERPIKNRDLSGSTSTNLDDDLDDLLNETSTLGSHSNFIQSEVGSAGSGHFVQPSSSKLSATKSKAQDDFDSWLDTL